MFAHLNWAPLLSPQMVILGGSLTIIWLLQASRLADVLNITPCVGQRSPHTRFLFLHHQVHLRQSARDPGLFPTLVTTRRGAEALTSMFFLTPQKRAAPAA